MSIWFWLFWIVVFIAIFLSIKIIVMKNEISQIEKSLSIILKSDTNNLITVSSNDKDLKKLATSLNKNLKNLRKLELEYKQGNQELKASITNISHDLRTPLTAIRGYLDLIEKEKLEKELARSKGMLSNEKFLSKAPEAKVQEEKEKLAKYEQMMAQVEERLQQMAQ